jgi:adenylyltransferase/sulfurtransferase
VLNTTVAIIASWQVSAALRLLVGSPPLELRLVALDPWNGVFTSIKVAKEPDCPCCGLHRFEFLEARKTSWTTVLCGRNAVQVTPPNPAAIDPVALVERLGQAGKVSRSGLLIRFQCEEGELAIFPDGRAIITGTTDEAKARGLYAKYMGT